MNWIGIAVGAGAGVVAVLISAGVMRLLGKTGGKGATVLHATVFAASLVLGREYVEPRLLSTQVESELLELPVYQALKQHEPEAYKRILTTFEDGIARKRPLEEIWSMTRPVVSEVTSKRIPHASDDVLLKFGDYVVYATRQLHSQGGSSCFSYINPAPGEAIDFSALLGKETAKRELDLVAQVVTSAAGRTQQSISAAEAEPDVQAVIGQLLQRYSEAELAGLQNLNAPGIEKRKYCLIIADLYDAALALPQPRNVRVMRFLMQAQ